MNNCIICNKVLVGKQSKYCSRKCHNSSINTKYNNALAQQKRGWTRRKALLDSQGGKCVNCGYNKNSTALVFHHKDPNIKKFNLDVRRCSNQNWNDLVNEVKKCILVCHNCHQELHYPQHDQKLMGSTGLAPVT